MNIYILAARTMACGSCAVSIRDDDVVGCLQPGAQAVSGFSPLQHRVTE